MLYEHADCEEVRSFIIVNVVKCNHDGIEHVCYEHTNCEQEVCSEQLNMFIVNLYAVNLMIVNLNVVIMMILNMRKCFLLWFFDTQNSKIGPIASEATEVRFTWLITSINMRNGCMYFIILALKLKPWWRNLVMYRHSFRGLLYIGRWLTKCLRFDSQVNASPSHCIFSYLRKTVFRNFGCNISYLRKTVFRTYEKRFFVNTKKRFFVLRKSRWHPL